ncbi:hypothetical protein [Luteolibacter sp. AS25]|uniref:hypothetical protein n=1 Tax=Luteolibacter sp. AS25 TaxID=3135776 RepID=UPI00398A72A8
MKTPSVRAKPSKLRRLIRALSFLLGLIIVIPALWIAGVNLFIGDYKALLPNHLDRENFIIGITVLYGVLLLIPRHLIKYNAVTLGTFLLTAAVFFWRGVDGIRHILGEGYFSSAFDWLVIPLCVALVVTIWNGIEIITRENKSEIATPRKPSD